MNQWRIGRLWLAALAMWLAVVPAWAGETSLTPTDVAKVEKSLPAEAGRPEAEAALYHAMVAKLADANMEGRGVGTKGIERARDYIADEFKRLGLKPAFGESYLQPVDVPLTVAVEKQELSFTAAQKAVGAPAAGKDFEAFGFSADGAFEGEAVFVGYSIVDKSHKFDSYAGGGKDSLNGKVAVMFRYEPHDANGVSLWTKRKNDWSDQAGLTGKVDRAIERGAVAVLVVNPPAADTGKVDPAGRTAMMGSRVKAPVLHVSSGMLKAILAAGGREAAGAIKQLKADADEGKAPASLGVAARGSVKLKGTRTTVHNVAGVLAGAGKLAEQWVIVGGHYDHIGFGRGRTSGPHYPGADDNASGAAGVLTLARWLAVAAAPGSTAAPAERRSVLFVTFSAEETGLVGSRHLARNLSDAGFKIPAVQAMVNFDMIGRMENHAAVIWGIDSGKGLRNMVETAAKDTKLKLRLTGGVLGPSDHQSFGALRVPVLCFNDNMFRDLHKTSDTADKINPEGAVELLRLAEAITRELWTGEQRMAFTATTQPAAGKGAYLGVSPDDSYNGEGCRIAAVVPGGPADKAGLKGGDVIVTWDGKKLEGPEGLMSAVMGASPNATVKMEVLRDGKKIERSVKLGAK